MRKPLIVTAKIVAAVIFVVGTVRAQGAAGQSSNSQKAQPNAQQNNPQAPSLKGQQGAAANGGASPQANPAPGAAVPDEHAVPGFTPQGKTSYALGMSVGENLHHQSVEVDTDAFIQGFRDGLAGGKTLLTEEQARAAIIELQNEVRQKAQEKMRLAAEANKKEGDAFLEANKSKEGVVALASGLQYKILTAGTGPQPTMTDVVVCNYRGTLIDGTEFDSSYKRGQPATFPVSGVIRGWTEALQLMPVGSKWRLFVPSGLAYGERGSPPNIGPNATLIFEVELVSIKPKPEPKPQQQPEAKPQAKPDPRR